MGKDGHVSCCAPTRCIKHESELWQTASSCLCSSGSMSARARPREAACDSARARGGLRARWRLRAARKHKREDRRSVGHARPVRAGRVCRGQAQDR
eukprot:4044693-Prymnesium_polylepis.1